MSEDLPECSAGDSFHLVARMGLAAIPFVGGSAVELFNVLLAPPIRKRRDTWLNDLAQRLTSLEKDGRVRLQDLQDDDGFVSIVMQASQAAVRNHQEMKLEALRNVVLNVALRRAPENAKREVFVELVNDLTTMHLRLLVLLSDPVKWCKDHEIPVPTVPIYSVGGLVEDLMPDDAEYREFIVSELEQRRLVIPFRLALNRDKYTTHFGDEFLEFISAPTESRT